MVLWGKLACLFATPATSSLLTTYRLYLTTSVRMLLLMGSVSIWACGILQVKRITTG
uniref:Uncharacterized protein n=1 Tax=Picea sitchensis TaxID=3332 RepID=A9NX15_PICSI|nr:unknown [Picea sitchensis]